MSDLIRKEFESAMSLETGLSIELFELDRNGDSYLSTGPKYAWWAWNASRECLVIELPDRFDEHYQDYYEDVDGGCFNEGRYINDVHASLTAAGVKYK